MRIGARGLHLFYLLFCCSSSGAVRLLGARGYAMASPVYYNLRRPRYEPLVVENRPFCNRNLSVLSGGNRGRDGMAAARCLSLIGGEKAVHLVWAAGGGVFAINVGA